MKLEKTEKFRHGSIDVASFLVSTVQVDLTRKDKYGNTAKDLAQSAGHKAIVDILSQKSEKPATITEPANPYEELTSMLQAKI